MFYPATMFYLSALNFFFSKFRFPKASLSPFVSETIDFLHSAEVICFLMKEARLSLSMYCSLFISIISIISR
jgi:hypothetical protein